MTTPVGLTKDAGFQIGVAKSLPLPVGEVWRFITSPEGLTLWLGDVWRIEPRRGATYRTTQGITGEVRGYEEGRRIRLTHRPPGSWETTVQVTLSRKGDRTVLGFHQERMSSAAERTEQREHWLSVTERIVDTLMTTG